MSDFSALAAASLPSSMASNSPAVHLACTVCYKAKTTCDGARPACSRCTRLGRQSECAVRIKQDHYTVRRRREREAAAAAAANANTASGNGAAAATAPKNATLQPTATPAASELSTPNLVHVQLPPAPAPTEIIDESPRKKQRLEPNNNHNLYAANPMSMFPENSSIDSGVLADPTGLSSDWITARGLEPFGIYRAQSFGDIIDRNSPELTLTTSSPMRIDAQVSSEGSSLPGLQPIRFSSTPASISYTPTLAPAFIPRDSDRLLQSPPSLLPDSMALSAPAPVATSIRVSQRVMGRYPCGTPTESKRMARRKHILSLINQHNLQHEMLFRLRNGTISPQIAMYHLSLLSMALEESEFMDFVSVFPLQEVFVATDANFAYTMQLRAPGMEPPTAFQLVPLSPYRVGIPEKENRGLQGTWDDIHVADRIVVDRSSSRALTSPTPPPPSCPMVHTLPLYYCWLGSPAVAVYDDDPVAAAVQGWVETPARLVIQFDMPHLKQLASAARAAIVAGALDGREVAPDVKCAADVSIALHEQIRQLRATESRLRARIRKQKRQYQRKLNRERTRSQNTMLMTQQAMATIAMMAGAAAGQQPTMPLGLRDSAESVDEFSEDSDSDRSEDNPPSSEGGTEASRSLTYAGAEFHERVCFFPPFSDGSYMLPSTSVEDILPASNVGPDSVRPSSHSEVTQLHVPSCPAFLPHRDGRDKGPALRRMWASARGKSNSSSEGASSSASTDNTSTTAAPPCSCPHVIMRRASAHVNRAFERLFGYTQADIALKLAASDPDEVLAMLQGPDAPPAPPLMPILTLFSDNQDTQRNMQAVTKFGGRLVLQHHVRMHYSSTGEVEGSTHTFRPQYIP